MYSDTIIMQADLDPHIPDTVNNNKLKCEAQINCIIQSLSLLFISHKQHGTYSLAEWARIV